MNEAEDKEKLIELLNEELGLTPYESRAYVAILLHGPLSPQGVNQKSGIPRPRTYDVLNSLVGKGLLMEQPGRPPMYAAVDPRISLEKMMIALERKMHRQLEEKKKTAEKLSFSLSELHDKSRDVALEQERVWVTRRDNALFARYCEAIRNVEKEFVCITSDISPPEKEILEAIKHALKKNKSVRVVRPIMPHWKREEIDEYEELIGLGEQLRCLKYSGLTFAVFDEKITVLWLPPHPSQFTVWISLPSLAAILYEHFEVLWKKAEPALPTLRKLKEAKA